MKKILLTLAALMALVSCGSDNEPPTPPVPPDKPVVVPEAKISPKEAQEAFLRAWNDFYPETRGYIPSITSCTAYDVHCSLSTRSGAEPMFYVINLEDNKGFAIMAANPAIPELLAISDNGNLDLSGTPNNGVRNFVRRIGDIFLPIDTAAHELGEIYTVATAWETTASIPALCKVKWDELYPFNQYTPLNGRLSTVAGSDAVAIAQAMSVFGKPTTLNGYTFDWTAMCNPDPTDDAIRQIARFLATIGSPELGDFNYGRLVTTAQLDNIMKIMRACGYENAVGTLGQENGTETPYPYITATVRSELEASRPVIVRGKDDSKHKYWHGWLIHGFMTRQREVEKRRETATGIEILGRSTEKQEYVLCNWGAYGEHDGYYLSSVFAFNFENSIPEGNNDNSAPGNYSDELSIIKNIYPTR